MTELKRFVRTLEGVDKNQIPVELIQAREPVVLKQLVADWPLVKAALNSTQDVMSYLKTFYNGNSTVVCKVAPQFKGRLFYDESFERLHYESYKGRIDETLDKILAGLEDDSPPGYYIASNKIATHLPGLDQENTLSLPQTRDPQSDQETVSIWIGNATTATCHFDALDNIACCSAGRRRFTLFPPDQVHNLYPGPLEPTPGGQVISLVDFENPDFDRFPLFEKALASSWVAELEPGDALFLPSMWWHHVEALAPFNLLINYWWNEAPRYMTSGMTALYAAMLGIRDKPQHEREGWKALFDYYIFNGAEPACEKIPDKAQGFLKRLDNQTARRLRALLINKLNR